MENTTAIKLLAQKYNFEQRVIKGLASAEEIDTMMSNVARALPNLDREADDLDIADLLNILTYARDTSYKDLVADYLYGPGTSSAYVALGILCYFYKLTARYAKQIAFIIRGAPWDTSDSLHEKVTSVAADYLRDHTEPTLLRALIETSENHYTSQDRRDNTLGALGIALGLRLPRRATKEVDNESSHLDDASIMRLAKERLAREENGSS